MVALANGSSDDILGIRPSAGLIQAMLRHADQAEEELSQLRERAKAGAALTTQQVIAEVIETAKKGEAEMRALEKSLDEDLRAERRARKKSGRGG